MITIHHASGTRGYRAIWACEELSTPYKLVAVDMSPEHRASLEWRRMNPVGKVPVMSDGELTMYESGAMVQYIVDRYGNGRLQPAQDCNDHALYLQWSWFAESTFARPLGEVVNHGRAFPGCEIPAVIDEMKARGRLCAQAVAKHLNDKQYLLGDTFSGADIMMFYTLRLYRETVEAELPGALSTYWSRISKRPAFERTEAADASLP
jgi:glutathione S-transferase